MTEQANRGRRCPEDHPRRPDRTQQCSCASCYPWGRQQQRPVSDYRKGPLAIEAAAPALPEAYTTTSWSSSSQISLTKDSIPPTRGGKSLVMIKVDGIASTAPSGPDTPASRRSARPR